MVGRTRVSSSNSIRSGYLIVIRLSGVGVNVRLTVIGVVVRLTSVGGGVSLSVVGVGLSVVSWFRKLIVASPRGNVETTPEDNAGTIESI